MKIKPVLWKNVKINSGLLQNRQQECLRQNRERASINTKEPTLLQGMLVFKDCGHVYYRTSSQKGDFAKRTECSQVKNIEQQQRSQIETSVNNFIGCLRAMAKNLNIEEEQKVVRLLLKDILIGKDTITINHSIPI